MLDFNQVAAQMSGFSRDQIDRRGRLRAALDEAARRLDLAAPRWADVRSKIEASHTSWLMPEWREPPDQVFPAPESPPAYTVLATDGSQIVADRHDLALCYLINIGFITIRYGAASTAALRSRPTLTTPDDSLLGDTDGDREPIAAERLAMARTIREIEGLVELIADEVTARPEPLPTVALSDGSLILWPLIGERDERYRQGVLTAFQAGLDAARAARVPIAGYISKPMSRDVVNSLRVAECPYDVANCDRNCREQLRQAPDAGDPPCAGTDRVTDAELFAECLSAGERSAVFRSGSKILESYRPENRIAFFYLHTGREVARAEAPAWVADDPELLDRAHALCFDQACKGDGYPVALAEAHEQAIVRGSERTAFFHLMERHFVPHGVPAASTRKAMSKRARRI